MEMIFKKYHKSERHTEKNYLIYDPVHNQMQFTSDLYKSISHRNFVQNCENILIGPIMNGQDMSVRVLNADGAEIAANPGTQQIFEAYLRDQGYSHSDPFHTACEADSEISAFGTVYYFPA